MKKALSSYEKTCNVILFVLLSIWFVASFGCGILFREWLDQNAPSIGNAPFGFWMAQQGSIITFVKSFKFFLIALTLAGTGSINKIGFSLNFSISSLVWFVVCAPRTTKPNFFI